MNEICNFVAARDGVRVCAVCEWCGRRSRPVTANYRGEPDLFELPNGWHQAPYSSDVVHGDGSTGSLWTCPTCGRCRVGLKPHPTRAAARQARATQTSPASRLQPTIASPPAVRNPTTV